MPKKPKSQGFTLIELLVVLAIIALISSVVFTAVNDVRVKARDAKRKADVAQMQKALELYYDDNGFYPLSTGATSPGGGWSNSSDASWTTLENLLKPYMIRLPKDPKENNNSGEWAYTGFHYSFYSGPPGAAYGCQQQWYMIVYQLEKASGVDPSVTSCDNTLFQYGGSGANTAIKTVGLKAR